MNTEEHPLTNKEFMDGLIRVGLIMLMVVGCFHIFSPFLNLILWSLILGVTLYPLHQKLAGKLGGSNGRSATVIVVVGFVLLGWPSMKIMESVAEQLTTIYDAHHAGTLSFPAPKESVMSWPLIGEKVYQGWASAAANLPDFIQANQDTVEVVLNKGLLIAKSAISTVFLFLGALIVAGIMMAYGSGGSNAVSTILVRIVGERQGSKIHNLATMTTRSVAVGVLGVAVIQSILLGVGFLFVGVPAAGPLAIVVLLLGIMQLPATIVTLPVIFWIWGSSDGGTVMNIVWTAYLVIAGLSDNILKPILLGRGVDAPMPVILIGALGGMVVSGFIGLFIGAVLLAVGYQVFMQWVDIEAQETAELEEAVELEGRAEAKE